MTGHYPKTTGVRFRTHRVPQSEETLAEILQQNGYQTAAFIAASVLALILAWIRDSIFMTWLARNEFRRLRWNVVEMR